jgi:hypothetical protein
MYDEAGCSRGGGTYAVHDRNRLSRMRAGHGHAWIKDQGSQIERGRISGRLYRHRVRIRIIEAQSPLGIWKQLRHRVFKFPAFIVNKRRAYVGWNHEELESLIDAEVTTT